MITSSIESNHLLAKGIETIQVNRVARVQLHAIWLQRQGKTVYSPLSRTYRDDISGVYTDKMCTKVASILQWLHHK